MKVFLKNSLSVLDFISWFLVLAFFCGSALLFNGNLLQATSGAVAIIAEMFLITIAIEIIIECLKNTKGIGTITGFITNGPEAVVLLAGLVAGDIVFAASTPLGSNFMNPLLLLCAALLTGKLLIILATRTLYTLMTCLLTAFLAGVFFLLESKEYILWLLAALLTTFILFFIRPQEEESEEENNTLIFAPKIWLLPAVLLLIVTGYFLDPVVSQAAKASHAPKGVIGFVVLSTLTSWPEFKSCLGLLKRDKPLAAILNITVSNITNIWLAAMGVITYILSTN